MAGRFFIVSSQSFFLEYIHGVKENERERERERERETLSSSSVGLEFELRESH
jgi:hypothetical protein